MRSWLPLGNVIHFIAGNSCYCKTFDIGCSQFPVFIDSVVDGAVIFFLKYRHMNNVFLYKYFTVYFDHLHFPRAGEYNEIVNIGTVANIFIFAQRSTHKTFGSIDIEFKIAHHHFLGIYIVESADF